MQNIAVQMTGRRALKELNSASASSSKQRDAVSEECIDPFMQIIMGMIAQFQENAGIQTQDADAAMTGAGTTMGAGTLADPQNFPGLLSLMNSPDLKILSGNPLLQNIDFSDPAAALDLVSRLFPETPQNAEMGGIDSALITRFADKSDTGGVKDASAFSDAEGLAGLVFEKPAYASDPDTFSQIIPRDSFMEAVAAVKETMSKPKAETKGAADTKATEIDVDMLQSEAAKGKTFSPFELGLKTTGESSEPPLAEQITTGIRQNVTLGRSEFTLKLKPESLGLITVKLAEKAGKTTLSIITASAQTAKLINSDLNALREAVAPMNVHVNEASIQTDPAPQGGMQQFGMAGQQFNGQQFSGQQSFNGFANTSSRNARDVYLPDVFDEGSVISPLAATADGLDTYI